ncbi:MAG TPA: hypothetical protein VFJ16_27170 [Longimicrobium sp.]|nr:hypothetical protein [Longimicrobium sp.]
MSIETSQALSGIHISGVRDDDDPIGFSSSYFQYLQEQANANIGAIFNITMVPLSASGSGLFRYFWQNGNLQYNPGTISYVNSRVALSNAPPALGLNGPISSDYNALLRTINFQYSASDQQTLNAAATSANAQITSIVQQYIAVYGPITPAMMEAAKVTTMVDYVVNYVVAQQWSGTLAANQPPLSLQQMAAARDLQSLLPFMPTSGGALLPLITTYLSILTAVLPLQQLSMNNNWVLRQLLQNTEAPSANNGGIVLAPVNNNPPAMSVGYTIGSAVADIVNGLRGPNTVSVQMSTSQSSSTTMSVNVEGSGVFQVPLDWFLDVGVGGGFQGNMFSAQGCGSSASVSLTFTGVTYVPLQPAEYDSALNKGWFSSPVLAQAFQNTGKDVTGYVFSVPPQWNLAQGGSFGMLDGVVIANFPTIQINYSEGDWSTFSRQFQQTSEWNLSFLGVPIAGASQSSFEASAEASGSQGGFTLTFGPSPELLSVPDFDKQAYVIGATVTYPAAATA